MLFRFVIPILLVAVAGCARADRNIAMTTDPVVPIVAGDATNVSADILAEAMFRAGFTRDEILEHGPIVRQSLATYGAAQVRQGKVIAALFSVQGSQLYVTSRSRGTFVLQFPDPPNPMY